MSDDHDLDAGPDPAAYATAAPEPVSPVGRRLRRDVGRRHLLVLPRPFDWMPGDVAADLLDHGGEPSASALVCERLTHDDEAITRTTLGDLASHAGGDGPDDSPFSDLSVLVVRR